MGYTSDYAHSMMSGGKDKPSKENKKDIKDFNKQYKQYRNSLKPMLSAKHKAKSVK